jgi:predicted ester cyclase
VVREGVKKLVQMYIAAFPDTSFTIEQQVAEGDLVATRWTQRALSTAS